jgi:hypothetical protein
MPINAAVFHFAFGLSNRNLSESLALKVQKQTH